MIIVNSEHLQKSYDFISKNNIIKLKDDPTEKYVKEINETINSCINLINKKDSFKYKQIKSLASLFNALIKLHKNNKPVSSLVNYKTAPSYKIVQFIHRIIVNSLKIDKQSNYSIKNNIEFINSIKNQIYQ